MGQRGQPGLSEGPSCGSGSSGHRMVSGDDFNWQGRPDLLGPDQGQGFPSSPCFLGGQNFVWGALQCFNGRNEEGSSSGGAVGS